MKYLERELDVKLIDDPCQNMDQKNELMIKQEKNTNIDNQFSMKLIVKDINDVDSVIPAYYKKKDAADYLDKTEAMVGGLTEIGLLKHGVLFPDGEPIYSIDDLDRVGLFLLEDEFMDTETDTTE